MKSSRLLWGTTGIIALLATCIFLFGFVYAINDILNPKSSFAPETSKREPDNTVNKDHINIVALGDSLTRGTGDESGQGYVNRVKEMLEKQTKKKVFITGNLSVNGYRTDQLLNDLNNKKSVANTVAGADIILLTIGGNDLFQIARNDANLGEQNWDPKVIYQRMPEASKRLVDIFGQLSKMNPKAPIYYIGLYYPFLDLDKSKEGPLVLQKWNNDAFTAAHRTPNITVVPTYDLFEKHITDYLSTDHFHPNAEGYKRVAERVIQAIQ